MAWVWQTVEFKTDVMLAGEDYVASVVGTVGHAERTGWGDQAATWITGYDVFVNGENVVAQLGKEQLREIEDALCAQRDD